MTRSSGLAGLPSTLSTRGSTSAGKNGLTVAPEAAMPATTTPPALSGIPPAPGNTGIVNVWKDDAATVAASYHRITARYPGRFLLGLGIGHLHPAHPVG